MASAFSQFFDLLSPLSPLYIFFLLLFFYVFVFIFMFGWKEPSFTKFINFLTFDWEYLLGKFFWRRALARPARLIFNASKFFSFPTWKTFSFSFFLP